MEIWKSIKGNLGGIAVAVFENGRNERRRLANPLFIQRVQTGKCMELDLVGPQKSLPCRAAFKVLDCISITDFSTVEGLRQFSLLHLRSFLLSANMP